ncbi:sensor histidine kinase [Actinoallomurus sp. NBC_01490]|uniref:sensor histidine kinase n=1 Tax=Actinoallomurus sp. NBC_01490 TaxID=2903557 RepID=UPI002E3629FC|nr:sensor histidine kinase [Actinoallomurus sp. NBC_01490]
MTGERGTARWRPRDLPVFVVPIIAGFLQLMGSSGADAHMRYPHMLLDPPAYALLATGPLALLFRRRYPTTTLAVVMAATVLYLLRGYTFGPVFLSPVIAIVAAVTAGRRALTYAIPSGALGVLAVVSLFTPFGPFRLAYWTLGHTLAVFTWLVVLLTGAEIFRVRRERADEVRRTRAEEERRQASEERLRIARELHDVLAHNISMINVQAGVALHLMDERPEQARTALSAIKDASKEALTEVRSVLGVLRQVDESAPRSPTAGLARLDGLISRARVAGITVHTETGGEPRPLPAGVDLAAFRIIQESLTNVTRHAGPGVTATVRLRYDDDGLLIEILDDGRGAPGDLPGGGNGIPGMRERVAALGGEISTGPRTDAGGFRVRARLPVPRPAEAPAQEEPGEEPRAR